MLVYPKLTKKLLLIYLSFSWRTIVEVASKAKSIGVSQDNREVKTNATNWASKSQDIAAPVTRKELSTSQHLSGTDWLALIKRQYFLLLKIDS